ncbi:esterase-like activity of phytase family protein [Streptomyces sp. NPDC058691]|uniref:esterase-like activity of phytase family protein n=1 Tax=Streptomyces sp. NPDC058691 TaxID=3346601 RepID=UPI003667B116
MDAVADVAESNVSSAWAAVDWFSDALDKTHFQGVFVGNLSALALDPDGHIAALSDRSTLFTLDAATHEPVGVMSLLDEKGREADFEALVFDHDGSILVASERSDIRRYTREGKFVRMLPAPDSLRVAPAGRAEVNETFEGLALQPGGLTLVASMEGSLTGDDRRLVRFQTWERDGLDDEFRIAAQYGYARDAGLAISDISASGDGRLLVVERGFDRGAGNIIRLCLADPRGASDVSGLENLTGRHDVRLMTKTLLADLVSGPSLGATSRQPQANPLLGNIEGMTVTGHTPDGRLKLLMVTDDNQSRNQTTRLYGLTVRLPGLEGR